MVSPRLLRTLLIALIAVALSYFIAERWPSRPPKSSVQVFCSSVVNNQPVQQVLAKAAGLHLSTMTSEKLVRVYSVAEKDQGECRIEHTQGLVTNTRLVAPRQPAPRMRN